MNFLRAVRGRTLTLLAAVLLAAFVLAPAAVASVGAGEGLARERDLHRALRGAFEGYWLAGDRALPPELGRVVGFWLRYHLVKGAIAVLLLVVLAALGARLWTAFTRGRTAAAAGGVAVTLLGLVALATVMANAQGAVAPFASLLPMLVDGPADGALAGALAQVREQLAHGGRSGALDGMVADFARYHLAMVVIAAATAIGLTAASVAAWRAFARSGQRRARLVLGGHGVLFAVVALGAVAVVVANTTVAADPVPALRGFFDGGW